MSIKVGLQNAEYNYGNLTSDNTLILNSFTNSNVITINNNPNSTRDTFIRLKNMSIGTTSNNFVIDSQTRRLIAANDSNIIMNSPVTLNSILSVNNNTTLSSNVQIHLNNQGTSFTIASNNQQILRILNDSAIQIATDNFTISNKRNTKSLLQVNEATANFNQNVYINNGWLYVNDISAIGNNKLNVHNAEIKTGYIDSMIITKNFIIEQLINSQDITPIEITKRYGNNNIINIYSCNLINNKPQVFHNFIMNKDGLIGLGTNVPDASLCIRTPAENIITYSGDTIGNKFKITKIADVGIGTFAPRGQLHICRNDDQTNDTIRRHPMINLQMNYQLDNNTSNVYTYYPPTNFTEISTTAYVKQSGNQNTFYILNPTIYSVMNNINNIDNFYLPNLQTIDLGTLTVNTGTVAVGTILMQNRIIYPSSDTIKIIEDDTMRDYATSYEGLNTVYLQSYVLMVTSKNTIYDNDPLSPTYNANNFTNKISKEPITVYSANNIVIRVRFEYIFEKNAVVNTVRTVLFDGIRYASIAVVTVPAPNFLELSYNNNFISSLTADGTLCLGTQIPDADKNKYVLYSKRPIYSEKLRVVEIDTDRPDSNISIANKNLTNINKLSCASADVNNLKADNLQFSSISGTSVTMTTGNFGDVFSSNINFYTVNNDYLSFASSNVNIRTQLSIGNNSDSTIKRAGLTILADSNISPPITNNLFPRNDGIQVTHQDLRINPAISVITTSKDCDPYIHLNNSESSYYWRIKKTKVGANDHTTNFQLVSDIPVDRQDYFINNETAPHIMQHVKEYDLLTFGEANNICIDTKRKTINSNGTSKVSIGIPFDHLSVAVKDYPKYFSDTINIDDNPYMLNIFGNVKIADIKNNPVLTTVYQNDKTSVAINGIPDPLYDLRIFGNAATSNLRIFDDVGINVQGAPRSLRRVLEELVKAVNGLLAADILVNTQLNI